MGNKTIILLLCGVIVVLIASVLNYESFQNTLIDFYVSHDTNTDANIDANIISKYYNNSRNAKWLDSYNRTKYYNNSRNAKWLDSYNRTKLSQYLESTFEAYTSHQQLDISRESSIDIQNATIRFYGQFKDPKLGACVSLYWQSRMFSFFSGFYKFKVMDTVNTAGKRPVQQRLWWDPRQYFAYLPKDSNIHAIDIDPDMYSKYADWTLYWMLMTKRKKFIGLYVYNMPHMDLMYSKIFLEIVRHETKLAFNAYFKANNLTSIQQSIQNEIWVNKTDDIAVHIRCQDILLAGAPTYGMNSLQYFNDAIKNVLNITLHKNMAIHIILFLGGMANRGIHIKFTNACKTYLYDFLEPAFNKTFAPAQIKLITDGTINNDFYTIINAPNVICGTSSYCIMGGIANANNVVFYKGWSANNWFHGTIADNIYFVPDSRLILSTKITHENWTVTRIAHYTMVINDQYVL